MRSTARRWRRRIGTMSMCSSSGFRWSGSAAMARGPVDLGVGLAEVEGLELPRVDELLPERSGVGELHERAGRRVRHARLADLDVAEVLEVLGEAHGSVADGQALLAE